ncbi:extracellular solute-binding protein [Paenibacillus sedimenti]|uniref:Extracellular solute-binding protein n=1 Tax=Paenibacillus sedimenti TaxID=2770274 RepID=A0A926KP63_9BACL|nr:extracellular solute-binding protein [Paenibacillus sedimenti]MBD0380932.1 extracellular solute-binding protein [Paenibacillus sedimenti]
MKMFRKMASLSLAVILSVTLAACGSSTTESQKPADSQSPKATTSAPAEKIKITMWSQFSDPNSKDGGFIGFYKALEATKAKFPNVEIEHTGVGGEAYKTKIKTASAANDLPDIFFSWGGGFAQPFVAGNRILPLQDLVKDGTIDKLVPGTTDNFTFDNKLYGLPTNIATANLYINTELFQAAGAKIPATWDDLVADINALKAKNITPIALGAKDRWPVMMWNSILDIRMGGTAAVNAALNKTGSFNTPEFQEASRRLKELLDAKAFGDNPLGTSYDESVNMFLTGKTAMLYMGAWVNGQINAPDSPVKGKVDVVKFPTIPGGKGNVDEWHGGSGETFFMNANVKNKDRVWEVYKYFMEMMAKEVYFAGSGSSAWKGDLGDTSKVDPLAVKIGQLSANATGFSYWWDQMLSGNDTESMFGSLMKFTSGKLSPEDFNKELQSKINPGK